MQTTQRRQPRTGMLVGMGMALILGACTAASSGSPLMSTPGAQSESPTPTPAATTPAQTSPRHATPPPTAIGNTVTIRNRSFGPAEITVAVGKVTFVNADSVSHTVSEGENGNLAPNARFNVVVAPGRSVLITFGQPGDYRITCLFHSEMHLLVRVH
jgi:plastocyanin